MKHCFTPVIAAFVFISCGGADTGAEEMVAAADTISTVLSVDLAPQDMPLFVDLGDASTLGVDSPTVRWNDEFGRVEVEAGEHFGITIMEDTPDLSRLKADLERDMLQKHTILEEAPDRLTYRSQFPDDQLVFIHFYHIIETQGRTFVVQDRADGRYNEADVARMLKAVRADRPV